ncbi:Atu2307/SP_0267 family LLM class monooxygenase [Gulosibacter faecalis]|uniref:Atu2307/SP_0267 family LLM class monooxygenase n=1 Tax=Gulosibacter faecalis TaxID=272240 RepID=A0ABW5V3H6_9MICO|nr:Atu2307/SP_0267 family LLM class monooxygenase [Gulosibacter faecalis]
MSDPTTVPTPTADAVEFGINTFGDVSSNLDGTTNTHAHTIREIVEQGALADELGIDVIGIGEHHRDDFAVSSPELVLAAIASRTEHIRLASAVTVLSSDDPVRLFERWSTLDAVSNGRAEIMIGRGSFTESFPLFGFEMHDYEELFEEKANLWSMLAQGGPVTWRGKFRAPLTDTVVYPPIEPNADGTPGRLATSVAVGGSPESVIRAAHYDFPLMLAIIGGEVSRFAPFADLYRRAQAKFEHESSRIGYHSPGFIGATDAEAKDAFYEYWQQNTSRIGAERGWPPATREQFEAGIRGDGALHVGSPETVAQKIARGLRSLGATRFDLKYQAGELPHELAMQSLRRYGEEVIPRVRELLAAG